MAAELKRLAEEFRKAGHFAIGHRVNALARFAREEGAPETFNLLSPEIPTVSEALYTQTREALARLGFIFIVAIKPVSLNQLLEDSATGGRFGFVGSAEGMRTVVSPGMEVAINPRNPRINNSNNLSIARQLRMIQEQETVLKGELPEQVRDVISMHMPSASVLVQLDFAYQRQTGGLLLPDYFARADEPNVPDGTIDVGRYDSRDDDRLVVCGHGWAYGDAHRDVFALPVVVLPRKLAA